MAVVEGLAPQIATETVLKRDTLKDPAKTTPRFINGRRPLLHFPENFRADERRSQVEVPSRSSRRHLNKTLLSPTRNSQVPSAQGLGPAQ